MPKYQILRMDKEGTPPLFQNGRPWVFDDPRIAQAHCKQYAEYHREKVCVKLIVDEGWRKRENDRMMQKDYRPLPWVGALWWTNAYPIWKDHFPHASLEKPGYIAYTKNEEDGAKDKQTIVRAGAYLNKYFDRHLDRHGIGQRVLVEQFMIMYGPIEVKFAETEADIIKAYDHGPRTCMNDRDWQGNGRNPAHIYAAGDLAIAYLGNLDGKVTARSLCWPERKIHSRVYGDVARLTQGFNRLGFVWGPPIGAKLKRIPYNLTEYKNGRLPVRCFIAPYIDKKNQQGGGHLGVKDMKDHLIICNDSEPGSHHCGLADGTTGNYVPREDEATYFICERCDRKVANTIEVYPESCNEDGDHEESQQWCMDCTRNFSWQCRYSGNRYGADVKPKNVDGNYWLPYYAEMYAERCEGNGGLFSHDNMIDMVLPDGTKKRYSTDYINRSLGELFQSQLTQRYFLKAERTGVFTDAGRLYAAKQELKHHAFQCDSCDQHFHISLRHQADDNLLCDHCYRQPQLKLSAKGKDKMAQDAAIPVIPMPSIPMPSKQNDPMRQYAQQAMMHPAPVWLDPIPAQDVGQVQWQIIPDRR